MTPGPPPARPPYLGLCCFFVSSLIFLGLIVLKPQPFTVLVETLVKVEQEKQINATSAIMQGGI